MASGVSIVSGKLPVEIRLRVGELAIADALALQPGELVDDQVQRLRGGSDRVSVLATKSPACCSA